MSSGALKPVSLVDSTIRLRWEVSKQEFDNCEFQARIQSPLYTVRIGDKDVDWSLAMYPKGYLQEDKDIVMIYLELESEGETYKVRYEFGIETPIGLWPDDFVKKNYCRGSLDKKYEFGHPEDEDDEDEDDKDDEDDEDGPWSSWGKSMATTQEFAQHFVGGKMVVVASLMICEEGEDYSDHMEIADHFVDEIRSISDLDNLSDFTVISGSVRFPCYRVLLAARSKYFEAMFRLEPEKKTLKMEGSPEVVKDMLDYIAKGCIPADIGDKAVDMVLMSDMYGLDLLTTACQTSMVNNLSAENAVETLIIIDKVKHVSKLEHSQKILAFIKKEAAQIVQSNNWEIFVRNYPNLVTEIILSLASS